MRDLEFTENEKVELIYDICAGVMAIIAVLIVMLELSGSLEKNQLKVVEIADICVYLIFVADYFMRLFTCKDKKKFFRHNIIDLIAIIPLGFGPTNAYSAFKLIKVIAYVLRVIGNVKEILFTNGFIYALASTVLITILGSVGIYIFEYGTNTIENYSGALRWSFVTGTTVGYGDISPSTAGGRFVACILMITGIGFLSMLTSTISTFFFQAIEKRKQNEKESKHSLEKLTLDISDLDYDDRKKLLSYYEFLKQNQ